LLHDFSGTHGIKLTTTPRTGKPAHGHDDFGGFFISGLRLRIWFSGHHGLGKFTAFVLQRNEKIPPAGLLPSVLAVLIGSLL